EGMAVGDSVAVNGACLTAVDVDADGFAVEAVAETLRRTALGALAPGDRVNLERAMRLGDRLAGHLVQGHVDGGGRVRAARRAGEGAILAAGARGTVICYVGEGGSIAVAGDSLTGAQRMGSASNAGPLPQPTAVTTLRPQALGRAVNLEVDVVAK